LHWFLAPAAYEMVAKQPSMHVAMGVTFLVTVAMLLINETDEMVKLRK